MIMKANKQIGFIYKDNESIDKIIQNDEVVFERGFLREKTSTTLPITFGGVGKNLKDYKIYGNTYQNSTSGKNLCGVPNLNTTISGVEINIKDGIITLNGTATGAIFYYINPINTTILNGGYTLNNIYVSGDVSSTGTKNFNIRRADDQSNIFSNGFDQSNRYKYNNFSENVEIIFGIYCTNGTVFNNYKFMPQLVAGTESDYDYESYTGGQPSPNPDYPQEIISCGDRTKNLCGELEQGSYNETTGAKSTSSNYRNKEPIKVLPNTNYIFSINGVGQAINVFEYKSDGTYIGRIGAGVISANTYFTTSSETAYINIFRGTSAGIEKWQIEPSNTVTPYEPYGYKITVNVRSDNLFDKSNANIKNWLIKNSTHAIDANSNEKCIICKVKPNTTYTIKKMVTNRLRLGEYPTIPTTSDILNNYKNNDNSDNLTTTTLSNTNYLIINIVNVSNQNYNLQDTLDSIMILESSTAPSKYIPYYNQTTNIYIDEPLRKISNYSDYIDFINGKVVRNIKEHIFAGTNDDNYNFNSDNTNTLGINILPNKIDSPALKPIGYEAPPIVCNKFIYYGDISDKEHIYSSNGTQIDETKRISNIRLYLNKSRLEGYSSSMTNDQKIELLKTWLSSNNITVDYILLSPTEESITLPNIPTLDGNNTLNIETEITPSKVYIKYKSNS